MSRLSIVTISFNQASYLQECIDSVVRSDVDELQYIVVDPGSTDGSRDIIDANRGGISDVAYERDDGPADGLNHGFARATGDVLGYLNADDRFVPGALEYVAAYFDRHPEVDVLCGAIRIIDENGHPSIRKRTSDRFDLANYISGICTVAQQATFFRKRVFEAAGGFNAHNRITWDGELLVTMSLSGCRFESVFRVLGDFRIYPQSITGSKKFLGKQLEEFERIRRELQEQKVKLHSSSSETLRRLLYKFNVLRHVGCLLVH
jgi:glycosyltransferase involved in cell wall biosynthesis